MNTVYVQPDNLREALWLLKTESSLCILAGGTDLLVARRKSAQDLDKVLDIGRIDSLGEITFSGDMLTVGAGATFTEIAENPLLQRYAPLLCDAAAIIGSPQIRNQATIGGNIANASPAADMISPLLVLDAQVVLKSADGTRRVPLNQFITGQEKNTLEQGELITGFMFCGVAGLGYGFQKIGRRNALAISRLNGACLLKTEKNCISKVRLSVGAATNQPLSLPEVEMCLTGKRISDALLEQAGKEVAQTVLDKTGMRASFAYKLPVIRDFVQNLIRAALKSEG